MENTTTPVSTSYSGPRREIGIPYAEADVDANGYFVICPECGETFYGTTKGSTKKYGLHYAKVHEVSE